MGSPIRGDDMYGGRHLTVGDVVGPRGTDEQSPRDMVMTRQALHATLLGFVHPTNGEAVEFTAPLHDDMAALVGMLRAHRLKARPRVHGTQIDLALATGSTEA